MESRLTCQVDVNDQSFTERFIGIHRNSRSNLARVSAREGEREVAHPWGGSSPQPFIRQVSRGTVVQFFSEGRASCRSDFDRARSSPRSFMRQGRSRGGSQVEAPSLWSRSQLCAASFFPKYIWGIELQAGCSPILVGSGRARGRLCDRVAAEGGRRSRLPRRGLDHSYVRPHFFRDISGGSSSRRLIGRVIGGLQ